MIYLLSKYRVPLKLENNDRNYCVFDPCGTELNKETLLLFFHPFLLAVFIEIVYLSLASSNFSLNLCVLLTRSRIGSHGRTEERRLFRS